MTLGVLVMAYGGPNNLDEVEPYLLDVRGYRPTAPEIIHEVRERYRQIGGRSPILEHTQAQAAALEAALNAGHDAILPYKTFVGMRHWHPFIKDTFAEMANAGIARAVGLVMAPHYSRLSIGAYFKKVDEAQAPMTVARIERWYLLPGYLDALADRVRAALEKFPANVRADVPIIFTAHSLPQRIREWNDPYPDELRATVAAVMERLGPRPHEFSYQSAALTPDPWLGPDAGEVIARLGREGHKHVLIAPIGFVCEHVEILYDVDIVFKRKADALGMRLERIEMLDTAPRMMSGLAELVWSKAKEAGWQ
ncbi:MAG TPA: ferrochelatase [Anaerolineales bacterium]|nr:ferrochelatase [Anaerolineales bacterium]